MSTDSDVSAGLETQVDLRRGIPGAFHGGRWLRPVRCDRHDGDDGAWPDVCDLAKGTVVVHQDLADHDLLGSDDQAGLHRRMKTSHPTRASSRRTFRRCPRSQAHDRVDQEQCDADDDRDDKTKLRCLRMIDPLAASLSAIR